MIGQNYIGGCWQPARSGQTFESRNPAHTHDLVGTFARSSHVDVTEAVTSAAAALPAWRLVPAPERGEILLRVASSAGCL